MNYRSVVVWDGQLSKLIGKDRTADDAGNGDGDDDDDVDDDMDAASVGDDDEVEPEMPADQAAPLGNMDVLYDSRDPAGLRLGGLSTSDAARYHVMKAACEKAGQLAEWKECLNDTVVQLSSQLWTQSLTNARSKKAAKKILRELQHYVCVPAFSMNTC